MPSAFRYRPRFVDIRVRPPPPEDETVSAARDPGGRVCDHAGCRQPATARAPRGPDMVSEPYWFCMVHAAEYNRNWNYFAGMSEDEIAQRVAEEVTTGGRPTWSFKSGARNREASGLRGAFRDAFGLFGEPPPAPGGAGVRPPRVGKLERAALYDLDLEETAEAATIRTRYLELVKLCHPDTNGGDRSAEGKLQRVIRAYKTLQKAKRV
jgi:hypothetical protein